MEPNTSIRFFEAQFERQLHDAAPGLNPFEQRALPHLAGRVLDHGCGLGNLALAAAERGCTVLALDASPTAIRHLREVAAERGLAVEAVEADLREHPPEGVFDAVVCIGLLMFFDRPTACGQLARLQQAVRPGGVAVVNLLVEGTTYTEMFDPAGHYLFAAGELRGRFAGWQIVDAQRETFAAPGGRLKVFETVIARKPAA